MKKIENECEKFSEKILADAVKRIFRDMNKLSAYVICEDYPKKFTFIDVLSIESQTKNWDEIHPGMHDAVWKFIDSGIQDLPVYERLILELTNTYEYERDEINYITDKLYRAFCKALNDHYANTKKIQKFVEHCSWL